MAEFGRKADCVAVDFDGVIHSYSKGWHDGTIYDGPVPGALEALRKLMTVYAVFIFTARHPLQVAEWLAGRGFDVLVEAEEECAGGTGDGGFPCFHEDQHRQFWDEQGRLLITRRKLGAALYIDDRALRFTGWPDTLRWLHANPRGGAVYASEDAPAAGSGTEEVTPMHDPEDKLSEQAEAQTAHDAAEASQEEIYEADGGDTMHDDHSDTCPGG